MTETAPDIEGFLSRSGWEQAKRQKLAADFSPRRFVRLEKPAGERAILMDAGPDQKTDQFVSIAGLLRAAGLSAPEIYAAAPSQGIVLMEDFGDRNIGKMIDAGAEAAPLYRRAVDLLARLHRDFDKGAARGHDLAVFSAATFAAQTELFLDFYFPHIKGREPSYEESESFRAAWKQALKGIEALPQTLLLRDFMPDNLMDLPGREGVRSVGLLDFQDGGLGPAAYDLASLCEAVRREGVSVLLDDMIGYYHAQLKPALSLRELTAACHVLAAQRHVRVLGIVARLAMQENRPEKLVFVPRMWKYMDYLMQAEALKPVRQWMERRFPPGGRR